MKPNHLCLGLIAALTHLAAFAETNETEETIVTAPLMSAPLTLNIDAKAPQQPMPANDGAAFLKTTAGFNVIRKGGTSGDPVFRGQAASRLNLVVDGMSFAGGCGSRMDPPTAYIFPESYDTVTIIKGPQTVAHGAGNSAGVVLFEQDQSDTQGLQGTLSLLTATHGRSDALAEISWGNSLGFVDLTVNQAESKDYEDGDGNQVHSAYERKSAALRAGYTPTLLTELSVDYTLSEAEASYADRSMDGAVFDRESIGLTARHTGISRSLESAEIRLYQTYIDHVMDNYSLRDKPAMAGYMTSNPDRATNGATLTLDWILPDTNSLTTGLAWQSETHRNRSAMGMTESIANRYSNSARITDLKTRSVGIFAEYERSVADSTRWISGLRLDHWTAKRRDLNSPVSASENLIAAFTRLEHDLYDGAVTTYLGLGTTQRPMDYWEAISAAGLTETSELDPETTHQIDAGLLWRSGQWRGSVSAFYGNTKDYVLVYSGMMPSTRLQSCASRMMSVTCSGNIDVERIGLETDISGQLSEQWSVKANLAWVRANNETHQRPLAQTPPVDLTISLEHRGQDWVSGLVARHIASQDRIDIGYGTIVGQDLSATGDATILSLNTSRNLSKSLSLFLGLDNLTNENYAEHLSRAGSAIEGYPVIDKVNEPGRTWWAKLSYSF